MSAGKQTFSSIIFLIYHLVASLCSFTNMPLSVTLKPLNCSNILYIVQEKSIIQRWSNLYRKGKRWGRKWRTAALQPLGGPSKTSTKKAASPVFPLLFLPLGDGWQEKRDGEKLGKDPVLLSLWSHSRRKVTEDCSPYFLWKDVEPGHPGSSLSLPTSSITCELARVKRWHWASWNSLKISRHTCSQDTWSQFCCASGRLDGERPLSN